MAPAVDSLCDAAVMAQGKPRTEDSDAIEQRVHEQRARLLNPAAKLFAIQSVYGKQVRERTMKAYGRLSEAHLLIVGVLAAALFRVNAKVTKIPERGEERDALFASIVIGLDLCEGAIAEGRYLQAAALVRQELETLAQLKILRSGRRYEGRAPKVGVLEESVRRLMDDLSAATHLSKADIVRSATAWDLTGREVPEPDSTVGTRHFPQLDNTLARRLFSLHLVGLMHVVGEFSLDLSERYQGDDVFSAQDQEAIDLAAHLLKSEGMATIG